MATPALGISERLRPDPVRHHLRRCQNWLDHHPARHGRVESPDAEEDGVVLGSAHHADQPDARGRARIASLACFGGLHARCGASPPATTCVLLCGFAAAGVHPVDAPILKPSAGSGQRLGRGRARGAVRRPSAGGYRPACGGSGGLPVRSAASLAKATAGFGPNRLPGNDVGHAGACTGLPQRSGSRAASPRRQPEVVGAFDQGCGGWLAGMSGSRVVAHCRVFLTEGPLGR